MDLNSLPVKGGFRLRGTEITRLETFTDAAFAFAVTMLVIAGDSIPTSFQALINSLSDIPAFAAGIAMILFIWYGHLQWSRRYGLEDPVSIMLSGTLILSILVFVYPLKLVFAAMFAFFSGGALQSAFTISQPDELTGLFVFYGVGFTLTCLVIALLFTHAWRKREELMLDELEIFETKASIGLWLFIAIPPFLSAILAWVLPTKLGVWSGFCYWIYPFISPIFSIQTGKKREKLIAEHAAKSI